MSHVKNIQRFIFTGKRVWVLILVLGIMPKSALGDEECNECHSGKDKKAPLVVIPKTSTHANLECGECHTAIKVPHAPPIPSVQCKKCHSDEAKAVAGSSHGQKLGPWLSQKGITKPSGLCLTCHGVEAHNIRKAVDVAASTYRVGVVSTCRSCHKEVQPIAVDKYMDSVHSTAVSKGKTQAAVCIDCHGSHSIDHSRLLTSKVFHTTIPQTCGQCHPKECAEYSESIHWSVAKKGFREAPVCTDCHGEHEIRARQDPLSSVWKGNVTKTCASCHAEEKLASKFMIPSDRVESYNDSFHGLSVQLGDMRVANCSSCHGNHHILPSSDEHSSIHPANLNKTCGQCHPGAGKRFTMERVHTTTQRPSHWVVAFVRNIYIWIIIITIGGMLLHNLLDLISKAAKKVPYEKEEKLTPRFSVNERIQHGLLALSFILLAFSGFALKFPNSPFGWFFQGSSMGTDVRRWIHRGSALTFASLALFHILYLWMSKRGREQRQALRPCWQDFKDAKGVILRYFRYSTPPLRMPHYSYVEKTEYWALMWGGTIMTLTGVVLYFINVSLTNLPLWVVDLATTVHFWEAVLATLAIAVWHGYWVVFDPEIYPLNLTWLIGNPCSVKKAP